MMVFDRVSYRYGEKTETSFAMKEVSFSLKKKAINGVVGANGSGKSTLLKLMAGILSPDEGNIIIDGETSGRNCLEDRIKVGIIFQNPDNQIVGTTVEEDLAFGLENLGIEQHIMQEKIQKIAGDFKLTDLLKLPVNNLSGGQKQLLCISSVMVMQPDWIVFDEPTSHLDPWARNEFWATIRSIVDENGPGIIVVSQLSEDICRFDNALIMENGSLKFCGAVTELREKEALFNDLALPRAWILQKLMENNVSKPSS